MPRTYEKGKRCNWAIRPGRDHSSDELLHNNNNCVSFRLPDINASVVFL